MIYEELLNVRALRHLTNAVKREVAACVRLQHHPRPGQYCTSLFTSHCWCLCILPPPPSPLSLSSLSFSTQCSIKEKKEIHGTLS